MTAGPHDLYERMYIIRRVEERVCEEYATRRIRMAVHLSIGQEGAAVGLLAGARPGDTVVGTHRSHALYLAKGGDLGAFVDELYSLPTGCSRGIGGSMHLTADDVGLVGSSAVLGGGVPVSVGLALAHQRRGTDDVAFAVTGDGGIDEGSFWESINLAAVLRLPVVFAVENNGLSTLTPQRVRQASIDTVAKARAFGVPARRCSGDDVVSLAAEVDDIVSRVREGGGPELVEVDTFRYVAHVGIRSDLGGARPAVDAETWPGRDPLQRMELDGHVAADQAAGIRAAVDRRVDRAFTSATERFEELNATMGLEAPPAPNGDRV